MNPNEHEYRQEARSYIIGLGAAFVLTAIPFALVAFLDWPAANVLGIIALFALVQIVVHLRFFLHINLGKQKREDLQLILFSALLLAIMAGGTIWIMASLKLRMSGH